MESQRAQIGNIKPDTIPIPEEAEAAAAEFLNLLEEQAKREKHRKLDTIFPTEGALNRASYNKHIDFLHAGSHYRERVVFGGNRTGKSYLGGYETALHVTGLYPDWWQGKRFSKPVVGIACGKDGRIVRDSVQRILLGPRNEFGTGFIPGECLERDKCTMSRAASGLFDEVPVKHVSGGWSILRFKSYDQGREAFEAIELDWVWEDEEAPLEIHKENLMRTMTTNGSSMNTFTPLKGETPLVRDLRKRSHDGSVYQSRIWWDDCPHITREMIDDMIKRYPAHELRARRYGEPQLGSGAIYTTDERELKVRPFIIPPHWPRAYGLDFGWSHPTAAIWGALDRESSTVYLYSEHRKAQAQLAVHASAIKQRGAWIPGISETQGGNQADGKRTFDLYRKGEGLKLRRATKGPGSVEAGILVVNTYITQGRLKVFDNLHMWFEEYRAYHRDKHSKVVSVMDDLLDSTRYLIVGIHKHAKTEIEATVTQASNVRELKFGRGRQR